MKRKAYILTAAFIILLGIIFLGSAKTQTGRIHPALEEKLQKLALGEKLTVIVELMEQERPYDVAARMPGAKRKVRAREVVKALKNLADLHQGPLKAYLRQQQTSGAAERVIPFWIFNGMAVKAAGPLIRSLAARPEVKEIRLDAQIPLPSPTPAAANEPTSASEWNIARTRAPEVWALNPAYNGTGAVIGSFDTGVDFTHPDLFFRYRGNNQTSWFDPYDEHPVPFDPHGHGTHTTGTAVGGDASGANIGVAPGATWTAAKAWNDAGIGVMSAFHQIFEWFLAPGGDPDNAPDVVNCSWAFSESGCDAEFLPDIQAWRAAGIFPVFAAGNDGPYPGSARSPGAYPISFAVGATDFYDKIAYFSGRGPSPCDNSIKPDVSAPGDGILSAIPFGYEILSGTSMAAPHITGSVAVLRSINPALTVDQLESILTSGAKDLAEPGPDNSSGAGRLDLFVSAQIAIKGPDFPVIKILATDPIANEAGLVPGTITISRTGETDTYLDVKYSIGGTAVAGSDYVAIPESVTIPAGSSTVTLQITPIDDPLPEIDETVILKINSDPAYIVSATDTATVTVKSDELISDLTISTMSAPAMVNEGQSFGISETTKNLGKGAADPSLTQFYLSTNDTLDPSDILIGSREVPALASGASSSGSTAVTIPQGTDAGTWYLLAKADAQEVVVETSETNNVYARSIKIGADLTISALLSPATASPGQSIIVTATTRNTGGGPAAPSLTQFYISANNTLDPSDAIIGSRSVETLAVGASSSGPTTVTIPQGIATDTWYIIGKADAEEVVKEISESNNTYARSINIGPDLDITSMTAPAAASAGQSIVITETTKNAGGGVADPSLTQFYISDNSTLDPSDAVIGSRNVPALAAGASSSGSTTVTIPQGAATDTWYIIAKADAEGVVTEISESNNTSSKLIKIGTDLSITALSAPTTASAGQSIVISDTTKNAGGGITEPSLTRFFFSANSVLDASDTVLGSRNVPALAAGASSSGSTTVTIPQDAATDTWYLIAKADAEEIVTEISETNNISSRSVKIGPDLTISFMSAPTTASAGQSIVVTETTKNVAGGITDPSLTQLYLSANTTLDASDILIGSRSVAPLAAGAGSTGSTTVTIPQSTAAGTWYIIGKADAGGVVIEISESNNTYGRSIKISGS
jgi:serine protease AprX